MSDRLKMAFAEAEKLPEEEQDEFADFLIAELEDDRRWNEQFARSSELLTRLADEARAEEDAETLRPLEELLKCDP